MEVQFTVCYKRKNLPCLDIRICFEKCKHCRVKNGVFRCAYKTKKDKIVQQYEQRTKAKRR